MQISIWEKESFFATCDVIVIGGGLAGLWCAYELLTKNPSLQLLIIDGGVVPAGASTRNAGFACFGSPTELLHDAQEMGNEKMLRWAEMRYKGIKKIRSVLGDATIDYDGCGGYECLQNDIQNVDEIIARLPELNKQLKAITGTDETFTVNSEKLMDCGFQGFDTLVENKLEGGLHSGKLVMALQQKVQAMGGRIMQGMAAKSWEEDDNGISVFTDQNITLKACRLLICTNALSNELLPHSLISPARGQILVTTPIQGLAMRGTFHFDEGFYYFRNLGNRVLMGGARNSCFDEERTISFETTSFVQDTLEHFLRQRILPNHSYGIEYRWSGIMGFTENKEPLIKAISARISAVVVCNGMGVALAPMIAEQIEI